MSDLDLTPLKTQLEKYSSEGRTALLPALRAAQEIYGCLPETAAAEIARTLNVPLADVFGVIDFYALLTRQPVGKTVIQVCDDPACALAGAGRLLERLAGEVDRFQAQDDGRKAVSVERAPCLGLCEHAPALLVNGAAVGEASNIPLEDLVKGRMPPLQPKVGGAIRQLTQNCGLGHPASLAEYTASGGYAALRKALATSPIKIVEEVKASGLVGRGGAAFPTGLKWEGALKAAGEPKYVVCNADESEPGTFKDRVLMEDDPHRTLEGLIIAGYAIGAEKGYWYIRGEYVSAYQAILLAIDEAHQAGYLGKGILGSKFNFEVEVRQGAGAYVCGEETALFESIEGKRGFPRVKPPFPTTSGLFNKPTAINNVETLCNIPLIIQGGAEEYRKTGTEKSPGTKLFCISGDVVGPGLYEVPFGITFRKLLQELAGGTLPGHTFQAALFGGAAGAFATAKDLDVRLTFEDLRAAGLPLGSGVIMVFDERRDLRDVLQRLGRFFAEESCGKCYPCQIGTQRQYEILARLVNGQAQPGDVERLQDVGWTMTDASLCGLGQTAASAVLSAIKLWPEMFR